MDEKQFLKDFNEYLKSAEYEPPNKMILTDTSGVVNPANLAQKKRAEEYGKNLGEIDTAKAQTDRILGSSLGKVLQNYISGEATIDDLIKAADLQKNLLGGPQKAADVINALLVPAMEQYNKSYPPYKSPLNLIVGGVRDVTPDSLRPDADIYFRTIKSLKSLIAKGLLGNVGNLTAQEQQDPLATLPSDYDSPKVRQQVMENFKTLLKQYSSMGQQ